MHYAIRKATPADLPRVLALYANARQFMAEHGNPNQWGKTNPPRETLEADIEKGELYVACRGDEIKGVFALILGQDPTYGYIAGRWRSHAPYGTIHRVASDGSGGLLAAAVDYAWNVIPHLRIDTHRDNLPMQRAIQRTGFDYCGVIYLENGDPRLAYEKI